MLLQSRASYCRVHVCVWQQSMRTVCRRNDMQRSLPVSDWARGWLCHSREGSAVALPCCRITTPWTPQVVDHQCSIVLSSKWLLSCCRITTFLDNIDVGDYYVHGDLEAYSCEMKHSAACLLSCELTPVWCALYEQLQACRCPLSGKA